MTTMIRYVSLAMLLAVTVTGAHAGELFLQWSAAADDFVAGYMVEVEALNGEPLFTLDAGEETQIRLTQLEDGRIHRVRVRPYDKWGREARTATNELVSMPSPTVSEVEGQIVPGQPSLITLRGANFATGAHVVSERLDVSVQEAMVLAHDKLLVSVASADGSPVSAKDFLVVNPVRKAIGYVQANPVVVDVSRSGTIDTDDMKAVRDRFGSTRQDATYLPQLDLNGDGVIDGEDVALIRSVMSAERDHADTGS